MKKLYSSKVEWIVPEKRKNAASNKEIATNMNVCQMGSKTVQEIQRCRQDGIVSCIEFSPRQLYITL